MGMSNRERFKAIARFQSPVELFLNDDFWRETLITWVENGGPSQLMNSAFRGNYFGFSHGRTMREIVSGLGQARNVAGDIESYFPIPPIVPEFEPRVLQEEGNIITMINQGGQTLNIFKDHPQKMPMYLDHPVKDWASWKEYKKRLDPYTPERWPTHWDSFVQKMNGRDYPVILGVGSLFGFLREWMGLEPLLYAFYDEPDLVEDMMDTMVHLALEVIKRTVKDIKVDQASFWEDMCYKTGPLISPAMFKKFMVPRYKKITELLHTNGIDIIYVDSDGNVNELVPLWLECGINYVWPLEVAAGNDAVALRKKYGKNLILGGNIDKRALIQGKVAIREEVMSKVPFLLKEGGYFPTIDHLVPPDITLENYQYYINTMREVAGLEKLPF